MTGLVSEYLRHARVREASRLASEQIALVDSIGDLALMIGAAFSAVAIKSVCGDMADVLRWSQTAIDWAGGDPVKGSLVVGSPLAAALAFRGAARWWSGRPGWREDLDDATVIARNADPWTLGLVMAWKYGHGISNGVLRGDDAAVRDLEGALRIAEAASDDVALGTVTWVLAHVLLDRGAEGDGQRGLELLEQVRDMFLHQGFPLSELPMMNLYAAREEVRGCGLDSAIRRPPVRREGASRLPRSPSCRQNRFPTPQFAWSSATFHLIPVSPFMVLPHQLREAPNLVAQLVDVSGRGRLGGVFFFADALDDP